MRASILFFISAVSLATVGCDSKQKAGVQGAPAPSKEIPWDWNGFPKSSELVLSTLPVDIQPKQSLAIKSEAVGIITFELTDKVTQVSKGQVIARMDIDTLAEQEERLSIQQEKQVLDEMKGEELDIPEKRKKAKEELEEARRKVRLVELILKSPAMEEMSQELFGSDMGKITTESLREAQDTFKLAERKVAWADQFDEKIHKGQQRIQDMDLTKSKRLHQEVKDRSVYTVPFNGELRLEVNYVEGQKEYTVAGRETIATLNDYQEIHAHLKVTNANWINLQPQRLYIQLHDQDKTIMSFFDDRVEKDERTLLEERKYIFTVPLKGNESLKRLAGTQVSGDLIYKLPEECHIIPKYDLALYALGKTDTVEWSAMVQKLWPAAKVLAAGQKHIAISYPDPR